MLQNLKMFQTAKYFETDIKTTFSYGKKKMGNAIVHF